MLLPLPSKQCHPYELGLLENRNKEHRRHRRTRMDLIIERVRTGMRRARLEGRHIGRRPLDINRVAVLQERARGQSLSEIAETHRISRATVSRLLKQTKETPAPSI